ncbi:MAG: family ATPase [Hydrocarboniphaga sp.]|uniref:ATP-dependent nuclease n=1 Tax=Hydrocarboniphaga sp. TaxID=2033016 RepID=UPI0026352C9C|nr:AAA family ATPase [Hydrocarboniphaga sp.]MDB5967832.1 family ATPase [Hydrocarboniphaga sp.]
MITRFTIDNFKRLEKAELELGSAAVFIGPNNAGKTTALQALALWDIGWRRWAEKRGEKSAPGKRPGVTINRRDLLSIPVPSARLLWKDLHTQDTIFKEGKQRTEKVYITLTAEGVHNDQPWVCALEFYYANEESFYCRYKGAEDGQIPDAVRSHSVVFLPPMSGLAGREHRKEPGEISVLIGEGQTAQVLRNLCWQLFSKEDQRAWRALVERIEHLFHITLQAPVYIKERSELALTYRERNGLELDLSSSGRGCQQVMLLLSYLLANPGTVLLLDEPDAHLEILRQRDVYNLLTEVAASNGSQIIAASHSEVVLQEAAERDVVMAFVGKPHRMDTRSRGQVKKALESIRMADYYIAEQKGWMLYLEGSTDLAILRRLAQRLNHPARSVLNDSVPVIYLGTNKPQEARDHFHGLREAKPDLVAFALFDRLDRELHTGSRLTERMWQRREIENYLVTPESLRQFVQLGLRDDDLLEQAERGRRVEILEQVVSELVNALKLTGKDDPWGPDIKVTDDFLDPLFRRFFEKLGTPQQIFKRDYHGLADAIPLEELGDEVTAILDAIAAVAANACPVQ